MERSTDFFRFNTAYRDFLDTYKGYDLGPCRNLVLTLSVPFG
jgi:hypothetical protein